jgi:hypothetical protein
MSAVMDRDARALAAKLSAADRQDLTTLIVATGGTGGMRGDRASALGAFVQLRGDPAMRGLARAQAHLGGFAFWNSHTSGLGKQEISETQILEL